MKISMCDFVCMCACVQWKYVADKLSEGWRQTRNYMLKRKKDMQNICNIEIKWYVSEFFLELFSFKYWRNKFTALFS